MSGYLLLNAFFIFNFIISIFGFGDWAYSSALMVMGVSISTFIGMYRHLDKIIPSKKLRLSLSIGIILLEFPLYKIAEYLNQNIYDGLITVIILTYMILISLSLQILSKRQNIKKEWNLKFGKVIF